MIYLHKECVYKCKPNKTNVKKQQYITNLYHKTNIYYILLRYSRLNKKSSLQSLVLLNKKTQYRSLIYS